LAKEFTIIIPTFNEISRRSHEYWNEVIQKIEANLIFVDDGSNDGTSEYLHKYEKNKQVTVIRHLENKGKAEAIRSGIKQCLISQSSGLVAYLDADGAFTSDEVKRIMDLSLYQINISNFDSIWTSRVKLSGRKIIRRKLRHLVGRTISSLFGFFEENLPYDTQSGYKVFKVSRELELSVAEAFDTRWFFDIELMLRLKKIKPEYRIREETLEEWYEIGNSSIRTKHYLGIIQEIIKVIGKLNRGY
jgi:glycosyltransferase involved in cell wall biosynthesis